MEAWSIASVESRVIHDINSVIVLISCQYICLNNHTYLTTDPRLLQLISPEYVYYIRLAFSSLLLVKLLD